MRGAFTFLSLPSSAYADSFPKGEALNCAHPRVDVDIGPYELKEYVTTQNYYPSVTIFTPKKRTKTRFFGFFALKQIKICKKLFTKLLQCDIIIKDEVIF